MCKETVEWIPIYSDYRIYLYVLHQVKANQVFPKLHSDVSEVH